MSYRTTVLLCLAALTGCAQQLPPLLSSSQTPWKPQEVEEMMTWASLPEDPLERSGRMFLVAGSLYRQAAEGSRPEASPDAGPDAGQAASQELTEKARGLLLRVVELGVGPVSEARHNLAILFQDQQQNDQQEKDRQKEQNSGENQDEKNQESGEDPQQPEQKDISSLVRERPEEESKMEEILEKEQQLRELREQNNVQKGDPVPLSEDW